MYGFESAESLEIQPTGFWGWDFAVRSNGVDVTEIDGRAFKESAQFQLDGQVYLIKREGFVRGRFTLMEGQRRLASAEKPGLFARGFSLTAADRRLRLRPVGFFQAKYGLFHGDRQVGIIRPTSFFRRVLVADLPPSLPLPTRVFVLFLVQVLKKRAANAAAAGA